MYGFVSEWGAQPGAGPAGLSPAGLSPATTPRALPTFTQQGPGPGELTPSIEVHPLEPAPIGPRSTPFVEVTPPISSPPLRFVLPSLPPTPTSARPPQPPLRFVVPPRRKWWKRRKRRTKRPQVGDYFTDAFMRAAMQQMRLLRAPLASVDAIRFPRPMEFMDAPTTRIFAEVQAVYWLAVASRIAISQADYQAARRLGEGAHLFLRRVKSGRHMDIATTMNAVREYISTTGSQQLPPEVLDLYSAPEGGVMAGYGNAHYGAVNLVYGQPETTLVQQEGAEEIEISQAAIVPATTRAGQLFIAAAVLLPLLAVYGGKMR